jgi:predicted alpha/beta-fold hydrolase
MGSDESFCPPYYLRNPYLQTYLAGSHWRNSGLTSLPLLSSKIVITCPKTRVRLIAKLSRHKLPSTVQKGLVVLLHGWEGSADSAYMLSAGNYLFAHGYDVFRLNLRDHGDSHHLNQGLFYATLLDEVLEAIQVAAAQYARGPVFLVGFSLGGNFTLRIAVKLISGGIPGLRHILCVSPVLNPENATAAIDDNTALKHYFIRKWFVSLKKKQIIFPHLYRFDNVFSLNSCLAITEKLISGYSAHDSVQSYFNNYTIFENLLKSVEVPTTIITAQDDPIIPISDFNKLVLSDCVDLIIHRFGGHNGFIENIGFSCWYERKMLEVFDNCR